jgi:ATP-dependent RNA helicase DBP3
MDIQKNQKKSKTKSPEEPLMNGKVNGTSHPESATKKPQKNMIEAQDKSGNKTMLEVEVSGYETILEPTLDFVSANFSGTFWTKLTKGFEKPTPIQSYCWPALSTGRDVIGIAETGSGKTLAFSMPIISRLEKEGKAKGKSIKILVLAPTRELAMQTYNVLKDGCSCICIYGGVKKDEQRKQLTSQKPVVVVGTPGRIVDFIDEGTLKLSEVEFFVLDEADRMLDMGFEPAIRQVVAQLPAKRQTIMFSATWPTDIQAMANRYLSKPIKITIGGSADGEAKACVRVQQIVEVIQDPFRRDARLKELLKKYHPQRKNRVIIFVLYKKEAVRLEQSLSRAGWKVASIHGDKTQADRTKALNSFKDASSPLLIATDVASRGLDIPDVEYVINFSFPLTIEDYIHRIGRTGRAGKSGIAHTFFTDLDKPHAGELAQTLRTAGMEVPEALSAYGVAVKKKVHSNYGAHFKEVDPTLKAKKVVL